LPPNHRSSSKRERLWGRVSEAEAGRFKATIFKRPSSGARFRPAVNRPHQRTADHQRLNSAATRTPYPPCVRRAVTTASTIDHRERLWDRACAIAIRPFAILFQKPKSDRTRSSSQIHHWAVDKLRSLATVVSQFR
jgi:hypothetical protein